MTRTIPTLAILALCLSATACAAVQDQMRADIKGQRCEDAVERGERWLKETLPGKIAGIKGSQRRAQRVASQHYKVARRILEAHWCVASSANQIRALRRYSKVSRAFVARQPKSLQGPLGKYALKLQKKAAADEATLHYFQVAVPTDTAAAMREHLRLYPKSRYRQKALQRELEIASASIEQAPTYDNVAAFARRYSKMPKARQLVAKLWRKSARHELQRVVKRDSVTDLARFLMRYQDVADAAPLEVAVNLLRSAVEAHVGQLQKERSADAMLDFLAATRRLKLPPDKKSLNDWIQMRRIVVRRELAAVRYERVIGDGRVADYRFYVARWAEDPLAAEPVEKLKTALAIYDQWIAMGEANDVNMLAHFLHERGEALGWPAVRGLKVIPAAAALLERAVGMARKHECASGILAKDCAEARWTRKARPACLRLGKIWRKFKRVRKFGRKGPLVCE